MAKKPSMTDEQNALALRFSALFAGYEEAFGTYEIKTKEANGKVKGRAITHKRGATLEDYIKHLFGASPSDAMGVIPLMADNCVLWSALDIDQNDINHKKLEAKIKAKKYPLLICRSKSGGAHLYIFFKKPVEAAKVRERLADWSAELGFGGCEIFPKQSGRGSPEDFGNWINMPYFGAFGKDCNRYGILDGEKAELGAFLDRAEKSKVTFDNVKTKALKRPEGDTLLFEAPPCLQILHEDGGFPDGTRNDGMFDVAVYLKSRFPGDWEHKLDEYNAEFCKPLLSKNEINEIRKSVSKKEYKYKCEEAPICDFCNKPECLKREYGIGETRKGVLEIGGMTRYITSPGDPVWWGLEVAGSRLFMDNETLYNRDSFNKYCLGELGIIPVHLPPAQWIKTLGEMVLGADIIQLPVEAGPKGLLWDHIEMFCLQKAQAKTLDEVWTGRPHNDGKFIYFRSVDLFTYLDQRRVDYGRSRQSVYRMLQDKGGSSNVKKVGGKPMNLWELPSPKAPDTKATGTAAKKGGTEEF